jgi:aminoglycoside phosphotransferase (APT) family kinase protein
MVRLGYPVARPLLLEESCEPFGGPFLLMEWVPGQTLIDLLCDRPWRIWGGPVQMAEMHARLHRLPSAGFPHPPGPFLERRLDEMRELIRAYGINGMRAGFDWLWQHRPELPARPCIIHLDFHPMNLLFEHDACSAILDWNESDVGDPHADVAATVVLLNSAPIDLPSLFHRFLALEARPMLRRRYLRAYRRRMPLDRGKLAYYTAWAAFRRLSTWGIWLHGTPRLTGSKPSSLQYVNADRVNLLRDCFHDWAGIGVRI